MCMISRPQQPKAQLEAIRLVPSGAIYQVSKTGFLVYCFTPKSNKTGAQVVYGALIPLVDKAMGVLQLHTSGADKQD